MNKKELTCTAAKKAGMSKAEMSRAFAAIMDVMKENLQNGEKIQLLGFGFFLIKQRPARRGFNPLIRKPITIKSKKVIKFNPSPSFELK